MKNKHCPICRHASYKIKSVNKYDILKCNSCRLEFADPMPRERELEALYGASYKNPRAQPEIVRLNARKNIRILGKYGLTKSSKLLDFGCGDNLFVAAGKSTNWVGYDKHLPRFSELGFSYDFITLWGALEHLTDPVDAMRDLVRRLKPSGKIALTTVFSEFSGIPYQHKPPEHTFYFSKESIELLFKKVGLRLLEYSPYFMIQKPNIYFWCVLNAAKVPEKIKKKAQLDIKGNIFVPTNEVFVVGEKSS